MENFPDTQNKEPEKKDKNINEIKDKNEIVLDNININGVIKEKKLKANHEREKYISLANFYINLNIKPNDYNNVTPESMNNYLSIITEEKIMKWEIKLYNNFNYYKTITEQKILKVKKDNPYQPVIVNDAKRTRVRESILMPNYKEILENLLTFYCISKDIYYKQGLNEIYGPLLLMKYKLKNLKLSKIFLFGEVFIDKFLPNYYYESDFCALKSSLRLFFILLKYHEPSVYNILDKNEILPEMYATNWLITLMSGKMRLDILFLLWDYLLEIDDTLLYSKEK